MTDTRNKLAELDEATTLDLGWGLGKPPKALSGRDVVLVLKPRRGGLERHYMRWTRASHGPYTETILGYFVLPTPGQWREMLEGLDR